MHALNRISEVTGNELYNQWEALELAKTTHAAFTYTASDGSKRMVRKISIDLTPALVNSMGHHDPLDGLITYTQLQATSLTFNKTQQGSRVLPTSLNAITAKNKE